jgi:hypothetical protein
MKCKFIACVLFVIGVLPVQPAAGTIIFSTLYPDGEYNTGTASAVHGAGYQYGFTAVANQFIPASSGFLSSIDFGLHYGSFNPSPADVMDVRISGDVNNQGSHFPSGSIFASGTVTMTSSFGYGGLVTFTPATSPLLTAGALYWVELLPHFDATYGDWNANSRGLLGGYAISSDGFNWSQNPGGVLNAFRVNATQVPEPAPGVLAAACLGALGLRLIRRGHGLRSTGA